MNKGSHGKGASVFVAIFNEKRQILLVRNREKWVPERNFLKPEKWGLPGGGVERDEKRDPERWMQVLSTAMLQLYLEVFPERAEETERSKRDHAAWREVFEETGFFIDPRTIEEIDVRPEKKDGHVVHLVRARIIGGSLKTTPGEDTLTAKWMRLPVVRLMGEQFYQTHLMRIERAAEFFDKEPDEALSET